MSIAVLFTTILEMIFLDFDHEEDFQWHVGTLSLDIVAYLYS